MVAATLNLAWRRRVVAALGAATVIGIVVVTLGPESTTRNVYASPELWITTALAALAGTQAFISSTPPNGVMPVILGPSVCFTFAILLSWGLGPAIVAQTLAMAVVTWRLHRPILEMVAALGGYSLSFIAAEAILQLGKPDPAHHHGAVRVTSDAVTVLGAAIAWLVVYSLFAIVVGRLLRPGPQTMPPRDIIIHHVLFRAALLLLSPLLAIAVHMNVGFVFLVFIPLYAVQRMAKLSAQRDLAARQDPLTGLANRDGLKVAFHTMTAAYDADSTGRAAILLADLDEFKHVNDALGHEVGDQLLVAVAQRLARLPLPGGTIARLGGDEFALLTIVHTPAQAGDLANDVIAALSEPISLDGLRVDITASIGTALHTDDEDFAAVMRHADIAMYDAKHSGGAVAAYLPGRHQDSIARLALLTDLRLALEDLDDTQIALHYQPQIDLTTGRVDGVEALLRWLHPVHGLIDTETLIGMAEHSSIMHLLTSRIIDDVVAQVGLWSAHGIHIRASINVSARDLYGDDIVPRLAGLMSRYGVEPSRIQIEITESALMGDPNRAMGTVQRISALGIAISLDDFGTGYSSLQHLRKMPISEIKIDRSFVAGMADNHDDATIVRSTIGLARSLGIRTVAEGVENEYTRTLLIEANCTLIQGWLTASPMPADDVTAWLINERIAYEPS